MLLRRPDFIMDLAERLTIGGLDTHRLRQALAVELTLKQDADGEIIEYNQPPALAKGFELWEAVKRAGQAGHDIARERQSLSRALAVFGDETARGGNIRLCNEVNRVLLCIHRRRGRNQRWSAQLTATQIAHIRTIMDGMNEVIAKDDAHLGIG